MLTALILLVGSFITPNPGGMGAPAAGSEPRGLLKITRHPAFVGFSLFGIAHMLMNGWAGDVIFFGLFPALGILGGMHQDRRKIRELGDRYREFVAIAIAKFANLAPVLMHPAQDSERRKQPEENHVAGAPVHQHVRNSKQAESNKTRMPRDLQESARSAPGRRRAHSG